MSIRTSEHGIYDYQVAMLKDYRIFNKLILLKAVRQRGWEDDKPRREKGTVNEEKLDDNIIRARSKVFEYACCNDWDYFVTLTLNKDKHDRSDLKGFISKFSQWVRNRNRIHNQHMRYLLIPEKHKDGNWHMHGLMHGIPEDEIVINTNGYKDWLPYKEKFGFISMGKVRNPEATAKYCTKYITKHVNSTVKEINAHIYYCSKYLDKSLLIKKGTLCESVPNWDFENDYVKLKHYKTDIAELVHLLN